MPDSGFATALRTAVSLRGLPLVRICSRLAERGICLTPATLSYWQRGRSQPERFESLRAVGELEVILNLPTGSLRTLLEPQRPRGRSCRPEDNTAIQRLFGNGSPQEQALGEAFRYFNTGLRALSIRESVVLDEARCIQKVSVSQVLRATRDGGDRLIAVHQVDDSAALRVNVAVHCGRLGETCFDRRLGCVVTEILFGRPLRTGETAVVEYDLVVDGCRVQSVFHERSVRAGLRELLLHVRFHPDALPANCRSYYRPRPNSEPEHSRRIALDASQTAHILPSRCTPGFHGMAWEWPGNPRRT
jgi:hypothetical protein